MAFIDNQLFQFKTLIENSIITGGAKGKEFMIRSSVHINLIHDAVKRGSLTLGLKLQTYIRALERQSQN